MSLGIGDRLAEVRRRIRVAAEAAGRDPSEITLVTVSKTHPPEVVAEAVAAGAVVLGENRVQEAAAKRPQVPGAEWHLIGPLQRNKAKLALETFDAIHTVDTARLADRLQRLLEKHFPDRRVPVLLEINVGDEPQKAGALPGDAAELLRHALGLEALEVRGLMAIPPFGDAPEASRAYFRTLRELRDRLQDDAGAALPELSMGMTHDFEIAVAEGATIVRVGTAIFGPRNPR
jgi:pyridoxal phosphate enzyme (YggS family)